MITAFQAAFNKQTKYAKVLIHTVPILENFLAEYSINSNEDKDKFINSLGVNLNNYSVATSFNLAMQETLGDQAKTNRNSFLDFHKKMQKEFPE